MMIWKTNGEDDCFKNSTTVCFSDIKHVQSCSSDPCISNFNACVLFYGLIFLPPHVKQATLTEPSDESLADCGCGSSSFLTLIELPKVCYFLECVELLISPKSPPALFETSLILLRCLPPPHCAVCLSVLRAPQPSPPVHFSLQTFAHLTHRLIPHIHSFTIYLFLTCLFTTVQYIIPHSVLVSVLPSGNIRL